MIEIREGKPGCRIRNSTSWVDGAQIPGFEGIYENFYKFQKFILKFRVFLYNLDSRGSPQKSTPQFCTAPILHLCYECFLML